MLDQRRWGWILADESDAIRTTHRVISLIVESVEYVFFFHLHHALLVCICIQVVLAVAVSMSTTDASGKHSVCSDAQNKTKQKPSLRQPVKTRCDCSPRQQNSSCKSSDAYANIRNQRKFAEPMVCGALCYQTVCVAFSRRRMSSIGHTTSPFSNSKGCK